MKLAVVVKSPMSVGGWHFLYMISSHLKQIHDNWKITIFKINDATYNNLLYKEKFETASIEVIDLPEYRRNIQYSSAKTILKKYFIYRKNCKINNLNISMEQQFKSLLNSYDVLYYPWPYVKEPFKINKPTFFTPHDFIYSHWFGLSCGDFYDYNFFIYNKTIQEKFLSFCTPIVTTEFSAHELSNVFPFMDKKIHVVHLSSLSSSLAFQDPKLVLNKYNINFKYILWPSNNSYHKNLSQLIGAYYLVKSKYPNLKLLLTGYGTENIKVKCNNIYFCEHVVDDNDFDIAGLGLLPMDDYPAILKSAELVVNSSLCEGGPGSALDAWQVGTPVAMSNIPPFIEYSKFLKTNAEFFNPKDNTDISKAIIKILDNKDKYMSLARKSMNNILKYDWKTIAEQFANIFLFKKKNNLFYK